MSSCGRGTWPCSRCWPERRSFSGWCSGSTPRRRDRGGPGAGVFVGQIAENGVFLSLFAIYVLLTVLLPLAVSVVSGDSVAGEAGLGTLRTLLTVPAGRTRLLATKYATIVVFCFAATLHRRRSRAGDGRDLLPGRPGHAAVR